MSIAQDSYVDSERLRLYPYLHSYKFVRSYEEPY